MKRGITILLSLCVLATVGYFTATTIGSILDRFLDDNTPAGQVEAEKLQASNAGLLAASADQR